MYTYRYTHLRSILSFHADRIWSELAPYSYGLALAFLSFPTFLITGINWTRLFPPERAAAERGAF